MLHFNRFRTSLTRFEAPRCPIHSCHMKRRGSTVIRVDRHYRRAKRWRCPVPGCNAQHFRF